MPTIDFVLQKMGSAVWALAVGVIVVYGSISALAGFTTVSVIVLIAAVGTLVVVYMLRRARAEQPEGFVAEMEAMHEGRERRGF